MDISSLPYGFRQREITAQQILCHCAFVITAISGPKRFIDFVLRSAPGTAPTETRETGLRPHTSDSQCYHAVRMHLRRTCRYCASGGFCANPFEVICAPSFGRYSAPRTRCICEDLRISFPNHENARHHIYVHVDTAAGMVRASGCCKPVRT